VRNYRVVYCPEHPRAWSSGYVFVHIVVAEMKLGRLVGRDEVVHHRNEDKLDNDPLNLVVKPRGQHTAEHKSRERRGITMVRLQCPVCETVFVRARRQTHLVKPGRTATCCSDSCRGRLRTKPAPQNILEEFVYREET